MPGYTVLPDVVDALVDVWTSSTGLGARAPAPVVVSDGFTNDDRDQRETLFVGVDDPELEDAADAGEGETPWAALGAGARDDFGSVRCVAEAWSGGDDLRTARREARDIVAAAEAALKTAPQNPWLGVPGVLFGGVGDVSLRQNRNDRGVIVQLVFTVNYRARI